MLKTLQHNVQTGRPIIVNADDIRMADVTPLPTRKMVDYLGDQGMRIACGADGKLHVRINPFGGEAA